MIIMIMAGWAGYFASPQSIGCTGMTGVGVPTGYKGVYACN